MRRRRGILRRIERIKQESNLQHGQDDPGVGADHDEPSGGGARGEKSNAAGEHEDVERPAQEEAGGKTDHGGRVGAWVLPEIWRRGITRRSQAAEHRHQDQRADGDAEPGDDGDRNRAMRGAGGRGAEVSERRV
jgi:hypothetical protein